MPETPLSKSPYCQSLSPLHANAGPRLSRSSSSSSRTTTRTNCFTVHSTTKAGAELVIKDGNSDEIEGSAMTLSAIAETLRSGTEDEITLALFETQQVLENCREDAVNILVPVICEQLLERIPAIQISAAETLLLVVSSKVPTNLAKVICDTAFELIKTSSNDCVCELGGQTLVKTLPYVSWSPEELDQIVDKLETRHGSSDDTKSHAMSRHLTARILGSLAMCSHHEDLTKRIMHRAMSLANDKDVEVRGMVAESMSFIGASINISIVEGQLWTFISKLIGDENARVHAASLRTLSFIAAAHMKNHPSSILYKLRIPPMLIEQFGKIRRAAEADQRTVDDDTYLVLEISSEIFGDLVNCCWDHLPDDATRKEAFKAFLAMTTCNAPIVRKYCASNVPLLAQCFLKRHRIEMSNIVEFLSRDSEPETRYVLASRIHLTVKTLAGSDTINNLFKAVLALLQDSNPLVRKTTLRHFEELIAELSKHIGYDSVQKLEPIFQNLHLLSEGNWRTQELLSRQLSMAAPLVPPPSIRSNVLPLLFTLAEQSSYLVRKAAMAAVATCMRYIPDTLEREKEMAYFRAEWAKGKIYWMRIAFIDSARAALKSYSRCLFRDTFASELLRLADDPVSNVRVRVAQILPLSTTACHQMLEFRNALAKLKEDRDKDVQDSLEGIEERIMEVLEKGQECFEEDMKKEEEEQDLYSKHINAQREAFRKKKGNINRAKTMFLRKSGRVLPISTAKPSCQSSPSRRKEKESNCAPEHKEVPSHAKLTESISGSSGESLQNRECVNSEANERAKSGILSRSTLGDKSSFYSKSSGLSSPLRSPRRSSTTQFSDRSQAENSDIAADKQTDSKKMDASKRGAGLPKMSRSFVLRRS